MFVVIEIQDSLNELYAPWKAGQTIWLVFTRNSKQVLDGCFNWMIPNHYMKHGCFTKHSFKTGCLGFQVDMKAMPYFFVFKGVRGCFQLSSPTECLYSDAGNSTSKEVGHFQNGYPPEG